MTPDPLPLTEFCTAGHADPGLVEHEGALVALHERGTLRLIDRGRHDSYRRWRMRWGSGQNEVRAVLAVAEPSGADRAQFWFHAKAKRSWGLRSTVNPARHAGLDAHTLSDPAASFSLTQQNLLVDLEEVDFLEFTFNQEMRESPVLVFHGRPGDRMPQQMIRFRAATLGACGLLPVDDSVRERVNALLPDSRRIPENAARLYLPPWWVGHADDPVIPRDQWDRPGRWSTVVDTVLRANSWRAGGRSPVRGSGWDALLVDPMADERVLPASRGGGLRWTPAPREGEHTLRKRLTQAHDEQRRARRDAADAGELIGERSTSADALTTDVTRSRRSRRRLAELTHQLRRQRDEAEADLRDGAVAEAWCRARDAELEASLHAQELDQAERELYVLHSRVERQQRQRHEQAAADSSPTEPDAPRRTFAKFSELLAAAREDLPGVRLGPGVDQASKLDGHQRSQQWLRRCWDVLELLDGYAHDRRTATDLAAQHLRGFAHYVRERGGERGIAASLVGSGESEMVSNTPRYREARTFPVPSAIHPSGQEFFAAHVKIDRGGGLAPRLHYLDDTAGETGLVHVGYLGPHLPSPETN